MKRFLIAGLTTLTLGFGIGYLVSMDSSTLPTLAKHGADDPAGDQRRGRGGDDGLNHASKSGSFILVKHGADDPAGDDRGGKRGGKGRGADDGINHAKKGRGGHDDGILHAKKGRGGHDDGILHAKKGRGGKDDGILHTMRSSDDLNLQARGRRPGNHV